MDEHTEYQEIKGFGAAIADWLYSHNNDATYIIGLVNDLGISMVRLFLIEEFEPVNDNSDPNVSGTFPGGDVSVYTQVLQKLNQAGLERVVLSLFSPPGWMKTNNNIVGGKLRTDMYEEFAEYYVESIKYIESIGLEVYAISPENEPRWEQWYASCVYTPEELREIICVLGKRFEEEGLNVKIFAPEDITAMPWHEYTDIILSDTVASKYTDIVGIHHQNYDLGYSENYEIDRNYLATFSSDDPYAIEFWNSEMSGYEAGWNGAFKLAEGLFTNLRHGKMNATIYGSPSIPSGMDLDAEALMLDKSPTERYYVAKHFFKFIRPGSIMINSTEDEANGIKSIAFKHGNDSRLTVVVLNRSNSSKTIDLDMVNMPDEFEHYLSTSSYNCLLAGTTDGKQVSLQARSISTFVSVGDNHLPKLDKPSEQVFLMNSATSHTIDLSGISDGDGETQNLQITAESSNPSLVPNPVVNYTSGQTTGTLSISLLADKSGTATITITLTDEGGQSNNNYFSVKKVSFNVRIIPFINHAPTFDELDDITIALSDGTQILNISNIGDGDDGSQSIIEMKAISSNEKIGDVALIYNTGQTETPIYFEPKRIGTTTITIICKDDGSKYLEGNDTKRSSFDITVINEVVNHKDEVNTEEVICYPNPVCDILTIRSHKSISSIDFFSMDGKRIIVGAKVDDKEVKINMSNVYEGVYILNMMFTDGTKKQMQIIK